MGMWQGILEGMNQVEAKKTREKELQDARDERAKEFQQQIALKEADYKRSRADTLADYQLRRSDALKDAGIAKTEKLTEALLPLYIQRKQAEAAAKVVDGNARALYAMFPDSKDQKIEILKSNPAVASQLYTQIQEAKKTAMEKGLDLPFDGQALLDNIMVTKTGDATYVPVDYESIFKNPIESMDQYATAAAALTAPLPSATFVLDPKVYFIPDAKNLTEAGKVFDDKVIELAVAAQGALDENAAGWTDYQELITNYTTDPGARVKLRSNFGQNAYNAIVDKPNPYTKAIEQDPSMTTFAENYQRSKDIQTVQAVLTDPNTSEQDKAEATAILRQLTGGK
jgi:hypothetical protein